MLSCQEIDHEQSEIIGVCINNICTKQRLCCFDCIKNFHQTHLQDTIKIQEFINWKKRKQQTLNTLKDNINQFQQCIVILSDFINEIVIRADQIENQNYQNLTKEIKQLIIIEQLEKSIMAKLSDIVSLIIPLKVDLKQLQASKEIKESHPKSIDFNFQKEFDEEKKIKSNSVVIPNQKQNLNFSFSRKNKHQEIIINFQGNQAKSSSIFTQTRYVICDELITENSIASIKIQCGEAVSIGVCQQNMTFQDNKLFEAILNGAYILNNEGIIEVYSKDTQYSEQKFSKIAFGDIILVEVNMKEKKITWINQKANKKFNYNITDNVQGLYFIFGLTSNVFDSSYVQII